MENIENQLSFELLLQAVPDALVVIDGKSGKIIYINKQTEDLFGYAKEELLNQPIEVLIPKSQRKKHIKQRDVYHEKPVTRRMGSKLNLLGLRKNGEVFPCDINLNPFNSNDNSYVFAAIRDITEQKKTEENLESVKIVAQHDALTGLLNRKSFEETLRHEINRNNKNNISVVFIDVDNFKEINDVLGHKAGDKALCWVAEQLKESLRKTDLLSRFGGDEFVVALMGIDTEKYAIGIVDKIVQNIKKPLKFRHKTLTISVSVGITHYNEGDDISALIERADMAMYKAKRTGKGHYEVTDPKDLYMFKVFRNDK